MYKKASCTCRVVVLRDRPIALLTSCRSWLPSPSSVLKLPTTRHATHFSKEEHIQVRTIIKFGANRTNIEIKPFKPIKRDSFFLP